MCTFGNRPYAQKVCRSIELYLSLALLCRLLNCLTQSHIHCSAIVFCRAMSASTRDSRRRICSAFPVARLLSIAFLRSALFPGGDNMVIIVDDRVDVWNHSPNVIQVHPYKYFSHTGDINAPNEFTKKGLLKYSPHCLAPLLILQIRSRARMVTIICCVSSMSWKFCIPPSTRCTTGK